MKRLLCFFLLFMTDLSAGAPECVLYLLNGDILKGEYFGQDHESTLLQTDWNKRPLRIHGKYIQAIDFGKKERSPYGAYRFLMDTGQFFQGDILSFQQGKLRLQTSWSEGIEMDRNYLMRVERALEPGSVLFEGPQDLSEWKVLLWPGRQPTDDSGITDISSDGFVWQGEGKVETILPKVSGRLGLRMRVQFEKFGPAGSCAIQLGGFYNSKGFSRGGALDFQLWTNGDLLKFTRISRRAQGVPQDVGGLTEDLPFPVDGNVEMEVGYDPEQQRLRVKVNGAVVSEWQMLLEPDPTKSVQMMVGFDVKGLSTRMKVQDVILYEMSGPLPEETGEVAESEEAVLFPNGDHILSEWKGLDEQGKWLLQIKNTEKVIPMDPSRIASWVGSEPNRHQKRRSARDVRVLMSGGSERFLAEIKDANKEGIVLEREGWTGEFHIPFDRVERIEFNPYFSGE